MNSSLINLIIKNSFHICYLYIMSWIVPTIPLLFNKSNNTYNSQLTEAINNFYHTIKNCDSLDNNVHVNAYNSNNDDSNTDSSNHHHSSSSYKSSDNDSSNHNSSGQEYSNNNSDSDFNSETLEKCKNKITEDLQKKYGDNIEIEFTYDNKDKSKTEHVEHVNNALKQNNNKYIYTLKIKSIGKCLPENEEFDTSDIFVDTEKKQFLVKARNENGFKWIAFPLQKKSIVQYKNKH